MGCGRRVFAVHGAALLLVIVVIVMGCATTANAVVGESYSGWGHTISPRASTTVSAWRWDGATWQPAPRSAQRQVYIMPFAPGWSWTWDTAAGWLAMHTAYLSSVNIPGPANTGVPSNVMLKRHDGDWAINTAGTVIDGWDVHGNIVVNAPNVTIRRSIVRGRVPKANAEGIITNYGASNTNLLIEDTTIIPEFPTDAHEGFKGANATLRRVEITNTVDGIGVHGNNFRLEQSWIHDLHYYTPFALQPDNQTHNDGIQIHGGTNIVIRGNTINGGHNASIMITPSVAPVVYTTIDGNYFDYGGCSVNVSEKKYGPIQNLTISNNRFGLGNTVGNCGIIMPDSTKPYAAAFGNAWEYSGGSVSIRRG